MFHAQSSAKVAALSDQIFAGLSGTAERQYVKRDDYHLLDIDAEKTFDAFERLAPAGLACVLSQLSDLAGELSRAIGRRQSPLLSAVREGAWIIAHGGELTVDCRISARHKEFVVAAPGFALVRNLDRVGFRMKRFRFARSFEHDRHIDLSAGESLVLEPGEHFAINGFREVVIWQDAGVLISVMSTIPLGAYDAIYSLVDGHRLGLVTSELRSSSLALALRVFGAAGWPGAGELAQQAGKSAVRELRWAALNYGWRANLPDLEERLDMFMADPDPEIRTIAASCLSRLRTPAAAAVAAR